MFGFEKSKANDDNINVMDDMFNDSFGDTGLDGFTLDMNSPIDDDMETVSISKDDGFDGFDGFELPKDSTRPVYDNRGKIIEEIEDTEEIDFDEENQFIEFGVIDLNKPSVSTEKVWNIVDDKPGAFFIYNPSRDLSYSRICIRNKDTEEIVWQSPIKLLEEVIKIDNRKSAIVYMSARVIFPENIDTKEGRYEIFIEDEESDNVDFIVVDNRNKFEDIVVKREESIDKYVINHMLNYFPVNIDIKDKNEMNDEITQSIIIEKIGDKYTVLINKIDGILSKSLFLRNGETIYYDGEEDIVQFLEKIEKRVCLNYDLSNEEYNCLSKLLIVDNNENIEDIKDLENIQVLFRKDIVKNLVNDNIALIDVNDSSLSLLFMGEDYNSIHITTNAIGTQKSENIMQDIKSISALFDKEIILTGKEVEFESEEDKLEFKSLSQLILQ